MFLLENKKLPVRISVFIPMLLVSFLLILTLFMFPLLLRRTLLMFTLFVSTLLICSFLFFLLHSSFSKNTVSFYLFPRPSCFIQLPFSLSFFISFCETPSVFLLLFVSSFFSVCFFFSLVLSKKCSISLNNKHSLLISPKNCFSEVLFGFRKISKILLSSSLPFSFSKKVLHVWEKIPFYFCLFWKYLITFFEKWAIQIKLKKNRSPFWQSLEFSKKKKSWFFFGKHVVLDTEHQKRLKERRKSWTKKRGDKEKENKSKIAETKRRISQHEMKKQNKRRAQTSTKNKRRSNKKT